MDTQTSTIITHEPEPVTSTRIQPTNGVLKRHPPIHIHHFRHPIVVTYKECIKNYASANGGNSIDGCGEFMPVPTSNPSIPRSLYCDVCGCHRNFHRRDEEYYFTQPLISRNKQHVHVARNTQDSSESAPPISSSAPHMLMEVPNTNNVNVNVNVGVSRKRFRTKFTQDQKGKMLELAEKVGWKMLKRNDVVINETCKEIGVEKRVFKVWMHNNKNVFKVSDNSIAAVATPSIIVTGGNLENDVGLSEKNEGNGDCVHGEEKGQENDDSSLSASA